jgi:UDP-glucose 4-epimerase
LTIHGDGAQRRDFIHVRDVVEANIRAFNSDAKGVVVNIGSGVNHSVKELADLISDRQMFGPRRPGDAEITLADIKLASKLLGWSPTVRFEDGVRELIMSGA